MTTLSNETVPTSEQEQSLSESACTERQMGRSLEQAQEEGVSCSSNSEESQMRFIMLLMSWGAKGKQRQLVF